jgi:hypothetical protein
MSKFILGIFTLMTVGAIYMTANDVGVMEPSIKKSSREGSIHNGLRGVGRGHSGK